MGAPNLNICLPPLSSRHSGPRPARGAAGANNVYTKARENGAQGARAGLGGIHGILGSEEPTACHCGTYAGRRRNSAPDSAPHDRKTGRSARIHSAGGATPASFWLCKTAHTAWPNRPFRRPEQPIPRAKPALTAAGNGIRRPAASGLPGCKTPFSGKQSLQSPPSATSHMRPAPAARQAGSHRPAGKNAARRANTEPTCFSKSVFLCTFAAI